MEPSSDSPLFQAPAAFAVDFLKEVTNGSCGAVCCSPFSVSVCLAMLYAGAKGETRKEIKKLLAAGRRVKDGDIHAYFSEFLDQILKRTDRYSNVSRDYMFVLETANKLFIKEGLTLQESYERIVNEEYCGMMEQVDFNEAETVCKKINDWVTKSTHGMIKESLKDVNPNLAIMMLNAVYFNSKWEHEFSKDLTKEGDFRIDEKKTKTVEYLNIKTKFCYYEDKRVQVVRLPYKGEAIANYVFLPKELKDIGSLFEGFDSETIVALTQKVKKVTSSKITLKLPKFEVDTEIDMKEILKKLGMTRSFEVGSADFSGITSDEPLYIGEAKQNTVIKVNEKGTEAACVTRFGPMTTGPMRKEKNVKFIADHPSFYLIMKEWTTCVLFAETFT